MGYSKRPSKAAAAVRPKPDGRCRKHPKHQQSPGVCSICLSEKLSQLSSASSSRSSSSFVTLDSSSSISSCSLSSSSSSSYGSSPIHRYRYNRKGGAGGLSSLFSGKNVLTKSRSLAFVSRTRGNKVNNVDKKDDDRSFLSKLLLGTRKKKTIIEEGLVQSRTMREIRVHY